MARLYDSRSYQRSLSEGNYMTASISFRLGIQVIDAIRLAYAQVGVSRADDPFAGQSFVELIDKTNRVRLSNRERLE